MLEGFESAGQGLNPGRGSRHKSHRVIHPTFLCPAKVSTTPYPRAEQIHDTETQANQQDVDLDDGPRNLKSQYCQFHSQAKTRLVTKVLSTIFYNIIFCLLESKFHFPC